MGSHAMPARVRHSPQRDSPLARAQHLCKGHCAVSLCFYAAGGCQAIHGVGGIILQLHQLATLLGLAAAAAPQNMEACLSAVHA